MATREAPHLFKPLDGHQRRQGLALTLDDELVMPQGDPIQHVPDSLTDVHRGNFVSHLELYQVL
jgi:hypothetical protein